MSRNVRPCIPRATTRACTTSLRGTPVSSLHRYLPSPLLQGSAGVHALAAAGLVLAPQSWPWLLGALAANHAFITTGGLLPRAGWLGSNITRLPCGAGGGHSIALSFDDGPDPETTPRVLDLLDRAGARASFFCIGERALRHPALVRDIVQRGHAVENHTHSHPHAFATYGPRRMQREVEQAQAALADVTGRAPRLFRAVAGLRNPFLQPILERLGLQLVSWTRRGYDTRTGDASTVLGRLVRKLGAGDILLLHDGHAARSGTGEPVILQVLPLLLARMQELGLASVPIAAALPGRARPVRTEAAP